MIIPIKLTNDTIERSFSKGLRFLLPRKRPRLVTLEPGTGE